MRFYFLFLSLTILALSSGCATIVAGGSQTLTFDSAPQGATVQVDGQVVGQTPTSISLKKGDHKTVSFHLAGYQTVSRDFGTRIEPWFFGNILAGGLFGTTTDSVSGAIFKYSPDRYFVTLPPTNNPVGILNPPQQVQRFIVANFHMLQKAAAQPNPSQNESFLTLVNLLGIPASNAAQVKDIANTILDSQAPVDAAQKITTRYLHQSD